MTDTRDQNPRPVLVLNPLGGALHHYTLALVENLQAGGHRVTSHTIFEPSQTDHSKVKWVLRYILALSRLRSEIRKKSAVAVITWPVLGYLDVVLISALGLSSTTFLVMHDPQPLVASVGYDRFSRRLVGFFRGGPTLLAHSEAAEHTIASQNLKIDTARVPHPIRDLPDSTVAVKPEARPTIRVLGQFKPDRDLAALEAIAVRFSKNACLEIYGRRWPEVPGWVVREGFVSEQKLDDLLRSSDVVVIPYSRFFQSGIAIRALELDTPIVGPSNTSLEDLVGHNSSMLVGVSKDPDAQVIMWAEAVESALRSTAADIRAIVKKLRHETVLAWSLLVDS